MEIKAVSNMVEVITWSSNVVGEHTLATKKVGFYRHAYSDPSFISWADTFSKVYQGMTFIWVEPSPEMGYSANIVVSSHGYETSIKKENYDRLPFQSFFLEEIVSKHAKFYDAALKKSAVPNPKTPPPPAPDMKKDVKVLQDAMRKMLKDFVTKHKLDDQYVKVEGDTYNIAVKIEF